MMELLTTTELAKMLRLHPRSVRKLAKEGSIPQGFRVGTARKRWDKAEVEQFLQNSKVKD